MRLSLLVGLGFGLVLGCDTADDTAVPKRPAPAPIEKLELTTLENGEPSHVTIQHILIAFNGSLPGQPIERSQADAEKLSGEVLKRAQAGEDFDELVKTYTNDEPPGIYKLANFDQMTDMRSENRALWIRPRSEMVPAFGDVGFGLEVGEIGMAEHHRAKSPYGWHIIKRIR